MKNIIIDITSTVHQHIISGIQRFVIETVRNLNYKNIILLVYFNNIFYKIPYHKFITYADDLNCKIIYDNYPTFNLNKLDKNYIWLDIDSVNDCVCFPRTKLYPFLKRKEVFLISMLHDILPLTNPIYWPSYVNDFFYYFSSCLLYTDVMYFQTYSLAKLFNSISNSLSYSKQFLIIAPGSNLKDFYDKNKISKKILSNTIRPYILIVSTIEIRKNHILLLKAFKKVQHDHDINLIIAGKVGWLCDNVFDFLNHSGLLNKKIFVFNNANNDEIIYLYKNAWCSVMPSLGEGYGLPIVESLYYKCPVFASNIDVFKEVSQNLAVFFDNKNPEDLANRLIYFLNNKKAYDILKNKLTKYKRHSWKDSAKKLYNYLKRINN